MEHITKSNEDYLETILMLEKNGKTKSVDVAKELNVSKAAVSIAMNELVKKELIKKESYGDIKLTNSGRDVAISTLNKHMLIKKVLLGIGVCEQTAEIECCKIEHILSEETINCLEKICKKNNFTL